MPLALQRTGFWEVFRTSCCRHTEGWGHGFEHLSLLLSAMWGCRKKAQIPWPWPCVSRDWKGKKNLFFIDHPVSDTLLQWHKICTTVSIQILGTMCINNQQDRIHSTLFRSGAFTTGVTKRAMDDGYESSKPAPWVLRKPSSYDLRVSHKDQWLKTWSPACGTKGRWWGLPVISVLRRLRFRASLD